MCKCRCSFSANYKIQAVKVNSLLFLCLEMFTVERLLSRDNNFKLPKNDDHHHLESVGEGDDSGRESLSDIDPGEEGK